MKKKYLAAGSALVLSLSLCIYALNQHQVEGNKDNNRVSYVNGKQDTQKTETQTPDQVSKKEDIQAEQIVVKITDQLHTVIISIITMVKFLLTRFSAKNC